MSANYTELQAEVADWLERTDLTAQIKTFISFAETKMNTGLQSGANVTSRLRVDEMKVSTDYLYGKTDDDVVRDELAIPADYLELREMRPTGSWTGDDGAEIVTLGNYAGMQRISNLELLNKLALRQGVAGIGYSPFEYSNNATADAWNVWPGDGNWQITASYWQKVPPLTDANPINKILTNYPDVYLYGALESGEAFLRLKDTKWRDRFISAMDSANSTTRKAAWSGSNLQTKSAYARSRVL